MTKDLRMGKTLADLEKYSVIPDVSSKNMKILLNTARKLYQDAETYNREGDEELAYILYMKYFNLLSCIHKKSDYSQHKHTVRQELGDTASNRRIMDKLEVLSDSLSKRYDVLNATSKLLDGKTSSLTREGKRNQQNDTKQASPHRDDHQLDMLGVISCQALFERMKQQNVLIMDCRTSSDYQTSHLSYGWAFNVPEEHINAGMSAGKLQDKLDNANKALWAARSVKDHVVLMDWNSKDIPITQSTPIDILMDILKNWDPDVTYRAPIKILEGGYEYFIMMYPTLCTNPSVQAPQRINSDLGIIDDIEYPSINDITMKDEIRERDFSLSPEKSTLNAPSNNRKQQPIVDRSSKLAAVRTYDEKHKPISDIVKEQAELLEKAEANDEALHMAAEKLNTIYENHQSSNGATLTGSEQELLYSVMQLESKAEDYKIENIRLRDELDRYKRMEETQKQSLSAKEIEVTQHIESKINERQMLDEQHERERNERERIERKRQLTIAREAKRHYRSPEATPLQTNVQLLPTEATLLPLGKDSFAPSSINFHDSDEDDKENAAVMSLKPTFDRAMKPQNINILQPIPTSIAAGSYPYQQATRKHRDFSPVPSSTVGRGLTGLKNLGNTCYMNSILQCLSNTPQLTEYCITDKYKNYISRSNKTKGHIVEEVAALIKILWNGNFKCVASKDLRFVIGQYQQIFRGIEQQDSHEFLTILMDWLHSDLQTLHVPPKPRDNITAAEKAWLEFTKSKESLILHLFYGQIKSTVKCITCNKESATYECFSNLSLELPSNGNVCYLSQCMDMYFSGEIIHGWNCPNCKQKRDAVKKLDISKLPPVLVVHLKRFYADHEALGNSYKKKQNYLRFPLENLDMTPYIAKAESRSVTPKTYQLYGVSNHYGSMESGHYTAFCKSSTYSRWFKFDDQIVTALDTSNVVSSAAYILFYTWLPPIQITDFN